ncbi:MAG: FAD:protein FMN transferase, partial [Acidobacteriota bacterium]
PTPPTGSGVGERLLYRFEGSTMGTYFVVKVVESADEPLSELVQAEVGEAIEQQLDEVNDLMSTWLDDSELSRFNQWISTERFTVSPPTFEVMHAAIEIGEATGGALDVTIGPLVDAWGFGPSGRPTDESRPDDETIQTLLDGTGLEHLALDPATPDGVEKRIPELEVELSSLAKGYAVDRVADALVTAGYSDLMVEVGGEVRTVGTNLEGRPWRMAIERPSAELGKIQRVVPLSGLAMATSGDYRNYREVDGERVSHLLDPRTGRPIGHKLASVSVVDRTCLRADGLSTALMVMGPDEGFSWATQAGLAALFLVRSDTADSFVEQATPAFDALIDGALETTSGDTP